MVKQHSLETKKKISASLMGHEVSEETRKKISITKKGQPSSRLGTMHTKEAKQKMSKAKQGYVPWIKGLTKETDERVRKMAENEERKRKIGLASKGNQYNVGRKVSYETRLKLRNAHKGENSSLWKGGVSSINRRLRQSFYFRNWREKVFKRDDYTCLMCSDRGGYLHPHHLLSFAKYKEYRFDVDNGITLCKDCHKITHLLNNRFNSLPLKINLEEKNFGKIK